MSRRLTEERNYCALIVRRIHDGKLFRTRFGYRGKSNEYDMRDTKIISRELGYEPVAVVRVALRDRPDADQTNLTPL